MPVRLPLLAILMSLPILAIKAADDPSPLPTPDTYQSLADVPKEYHDGEKLTGCFTRDSTATHPHSTGPEYLCDNPFYRDEHGHLRNWHHQLWDKRPASIQGLPDTYNGAPCEGCLNEQQVIDVLRVYHQSTDYQPLGDRASIVRDFPWDGRSPLDSRRGCFLQPQDPYPNLTPYEKVNLPRSMKRYIAEHCKEPLGDVTWKVEYQLGWVSQEQIARDLRDGYRHHSALGLQIPWIGHILIHAKTGKILMDVRHDYQHRKARYNAYQKLFLYLPDSPMREHWDKPPTPSRTTPKPDSPASGTDNHFQRNSNDSRFDPTDSSPRHSNSSGT